MTPTVTQDAGVSRPALQSWRTTTAVRVFALSLTAGTVLSQRVFVESAPMLVVLCLVAAVSSLLGVDDTQPSHPLAPQWARL